jgi:hypothetical protein
LIEASPYFVAIEEGRNVTLVCKAISPITSCTFNIPDGETSREIKLYANTPRNDSFEYFGDGFNAGHCGIFIKHIRKWNAGKASCIVDLNDHIKGVRREILITITKELPVGK